MILKFGSFFGLTAVQAMFLSKRQIDALFDVKGMKKVTLSLAADLYEEVRSLRNILRKTQPEGVNGPYVDFKPDYKSDYAKNLTKGLNLYLESLAESKSEQADAASGAVDGFDLEDLDFSGEANIDAAETTSVFGENDPESFDMDFDLGSDAEDGFKGLASLNLDIDDSAPTHSVSDLAEWGASGAFCAEPQIAEPSQVTRFMFQHGKTLDPEVSESIRKQIAEIPKIPRDCYVPDTVGEGKRDISETSLRFLQKIYLKAEEDIGGGKCRIDYLADILERLVRQQDTSRQMLFFLPRSRFGEDERSWYNYTKMAKVICNGHLDVAESRPINTNIEFLLRDCNTVLGLSADSKVSTSEQLSALRSALKDAESQDGMLMQVVDDVFHLVDTQDLDESGRRALRRFITHLATLGSLLSENMVSIENLRYITSLYAIMSSLVLQKMYRELELDSNLPEEIDASEISDAVINDANVQDFINFVPETGICGLETEFEDGFFQALNAIRVPIGVAGAELFPQNSSRREFAQLLRRHVMSVKTRLGG